MSGWGTPPAYWSRLTGMLRRLLAAAILVLLALTLLAFAWPQLFGLERAPIIAQAVSLRGFAIAVAVVLIIALGFVTAISARIRRFAAACAVLLIGFALINAAVLASRGLGDLAFETPNDATVTVLSWNTLGDAPHATEIARLALESEAEIVVLPETTIETGQAVAAIMGEAGSVMQPFTTSFDLISKARSTTVLVSWTLGEYVVDSTRGNSSVLPTVIAVPTDKVGPTIVAVHLVAPIPGEMDHWRSDLDWIAATCTGDNVIMAGDFNATLDHFNGLESSEETVLGSCLDAAKETNNAAVGTWPTGIPPLLSAPIDHVMHTANWRVTGMRVIENYDTYGSDHRPVLAELAPAS
jgi:endonuclease/exonuclease/phosphatase (EEP) superfamily protein YafD